MLCGASLLRSWLPIANFISESVAVGSNPASGLVIVVDQLPKGCSVPADVEKAVSFRRPSALLVQNSPRREIATCCSRSGCSACSFGLKALVPEAAASLAAGGRGDRQLPPVGLDRFASSLVGAVPRGPAQTSVA